MVETFLFRLDDNEICCIIWVRRLFAKLRYQTIAQYAYTVIRLILTFTQIIIKSRFVLKVSIASSYLADSIEVMINKIRTVLTIIWNAPKCTLSTYILYITITIKCVIYLLFVESYTKIWINIIDWIRFLNKSNPINLFESILKM